MGGAGTTGNASSELGFGGGANAVSLAKGFEVGTICHLLDVDSGTGGGGGVRDSDLGSLKCANLARTDEFEDEDMTVLLGCGVNNEGVVPGTDSVVSTTFSEVIPNFRHKPSP